VREVSAEDYASAGKGVSIRAWRELQTSSVLAFRPEFLEHKLSQSCGQTDIAGNRPHNTI